MRHGKTPHESPCESHEPHITICFLFTRFRDSLKTKSPRCSPEIPSPVEVPLCEGWKGFNSNRCGESLPDYSLRKTGFFSKAKPWVHHSFPISSGQYLWKIFFAYQFMQYTLFSNLTWILPYTRIWRRACKSMSYENVFLFLFYNCRYLFCYSLRQKFSIYCDKDMKKYSIQ